MPYHEEERRGVCLAKEGGGFAGTFASKMEVISQEGSLLCKQGTEVGGLLTPAVERSRKVAGLEVEGCLPLHEMDRHRWKENRFRLRADGSLSFDVKLGATKYLEESTN